MPIVNPVPGSTRAANDGGYPADSGLDISVPVGTPCVAARDGRILYSEQGHTPWWEDTDLQKPGFQPPYSVLLEFDQPFTFAGKLIRFAWYTHLTSVARPVPDGAPPVPVRAGQPVGASGIGNRVPHLHFGLLTSRAQGAGQFLTDRQVADLVWPPGGAPKEDPDPEPPSKHEALHLLKVFAHPGGARSFHQGEEVPSVEIKLYQHSGRVGLVVNGQSVDVAALELTAKYRPKED